MDSENKNLSDYEILKYVREKFETVDKKYLFYGGALLFGSSVAFYVGDLLDHVPFLNTAATIIGTYNILKYVVNHGMNSVNDLNGVVENLFSKEPEKKTVDMEDLKMKMMSVFDEMED